MERIGKSFFLNDRMAWDLIYDFNQLHEGSRVGCGGRTKQRWVINKILKKSWQWMNWVILTEKIVSNMRRKKNQVELLGQGIEF